MIGPCIRAWRKENRYGIRAAAKMIGVSPATLSRIERGEKADQKTILLLLNWMFR